MKLLSSLDLFSGVGGLTRALHDFARPVAYCEIDHTCQEILHARMADGSLPKAPILEDVRSIEAKHLAGKKVDMIVAGWPCQDLSIMGLQRGLSGDRSGLIKEVIRLTDVFKPNLLFLENVPGILTNGIQDIVREFVTRRGYEMRWAVVPAAFVGAPHLRRRWFCLLVRHKNVSFSFKTDYAWYNKWTLAYHQGKTPRMYFAKSRKEKRDGIGRIATLGNSVVSDAVRAAFMILCNGFRWDTVSQDLLKSQPHIRLEALQMDCAKDTKDPEADWGYVSRQGHTCHMAPQLVLPTRKFSIRMDPRVYSGEVIRKVTTPLYTEIKELHAWSTPRHSSSMSNILTLRSSRDLPTQVRYEVNTPNHLRGGQLHPRFVEWMMGYPADWTKTKSFSSQISKKHHVTAA